MWRARCRLLEDRGLAGCHLEDQVNPKRCGHLDGKTVVPVEEMVRRVKAATSARRDPNFVVCARTDARAIDGLDAAIDRAKAYVDAGADMIFPEALADEAEFAAFRAGNQRAAAGEHDRVRQVETARRVDAGVARHQRGDLPGDPAAPGDGRDRGRSAHHLARRHAGLTGREDADPHPALRTRALRRLRGVRRRRRELPSPSDYETWSDPDA